MYQEEHVRWQLPPEDVELFSDIGVSPLHSDFIKKLGMVCLITHNGARLLISRQKD